MSQLLSVMLLVLCTGSSNDLSTVEFQRVVLAMNDAVVTSKAVQFHCIATIYAQANTLGTEYQQVYAGDTAFAKSRAVFSRDADSILIEEEYEGFDAEVGTIRKLYSARSSWSNKLYVRTQTLDPSFNTNASYSVTASFDDRNVRSLECSEACGRFLEGFFAHNRCGLVEVVHSVDAKCVPQGMERIGERLTTKLTVDSNMGTYGIWFDCEYPSLILRLTVEYDSQDSVWGRPLREVDPKLRAIRLEVRDVTWHIFAGLPVATAGTLIEEREYEGARVETQRTFVRRESIELGPDFHPMTFRPNLAVGTHLVIMEHPGVRYVWDGEAPKPWVDENTIKSIHEEVAKHQERHNSPAN